MADDTDGESSAWARTLREVDEMAAELREEGWRVVTVRAGHAAAVPPASGDTDAPALAYVAPDGVAESLPEAVDAADLDRYEVFRRQVGTDLFLVTRLTDPESRVAVLLVGAFDLATADGFRDAVRERGALHSRVRLLDGTRLLSVRHDDPSAFFPDPE